MAEDPPEHQDDAPDPQSADPSAEGADPADAGRAAERALNDAQDAADRLDEATRTGDSADAEASEGASASSGGEASGEAGAGGDAEEENPPNLDLPNFQRVMEDVESSGIELLRDVELNVKIELGRTHMLVEDVLGLSQGSVVELNKLAGDPVDVYVNDRLVARGEVLVLSENFCVRINEIVADVAEEIGEDQTMATEEAGAGAAASTGSASAGQDAEAEAGGSENPAG